LLSLSKAFSGVLVNFDVDTGMTAFEDYVKNRDAEFYCENYRGHDMQVAHLYHQHTPLNDIKQELGLSTAEVYRSLQRHGITPNRRRNPNFGHVMYFYNSGLPFDEIAQLTGYTVRHIRNIVNSHMTNEG